jgi:hypothetical protein
MLLDIFSNLQPYAVPVIGFILTTFLGGGIGVFLTRKKLFVKNLGEAVVALSDLMDGVTEEELDKFISEVKETVNTVKK